MLNCIFIRDVSGVFFSVYMNCHESFGLWTDAVKDQEDIKCKNDKQKFHLHK